MSKFSFSPFTSSQADMVRQPVIAQILPELHVGGVERGTIEIARAIIAAGGKAIVISNGGHLVPQLQRIGAIHIQLAVHQKNPLSWGRIRRDLKKILIEYGVDIVHVRSRAPAWIALPVAKSLGIATISTIHGKFGTTKILKRFYNAKMLSSDHIIAISDFIKSQIETHFSKYDTANKLTVIHRGVDLAYFDPAAVSQGRIINEATRLAIPDDRPVVMMPARPTAWKGHEILLRAVSSMPDTNFTLVLLGLSDDSGKFYDQIQSVVLKYKLESIVRLVGKTNDVPAAMMLADVIVMPSIEPEPFGRVAIEAQAMGRPVVAFDHGGACESITHDETGFLAVPNDTNSLAEQITKALSLGPRKRKTFAKKARAHIQSNFTTSLMCEKTIAIYDKLLVKK
ncbi:MAG: glycosyltransferase family 4 protein [Candidatus Puniceispirillaceae bacterium]